MTQETINQVLKFRDDRNWRQFHNPKDLALSISLEAAELLAADGIEATVVNMHTIKPLDKELVVKVAKATGKVVTVEEHSTIGGLGSAVAECLCDEYTYALLYSNNK